MSIIFEHHNCVYISHQKYIENVYKTVQNSNDSFKLDEALFAIYSPFKLQTPRKKFKLVHEKFKTLHEEVLYVDAEYGKFIKKLGEIKILQSVDVEVMTSDIESQGILNVASTFTNNLLALDTSRRLYELSGKNRIENAHGKNTEPLPILIDINKNNYLFPSNCTFYNKQVADINESLHGMEFDAIILDPPWWNKSVRRKRSRQTNEGYQMMRNDDLKSLPVNLLLKDEGLLIVWCTNSPQQEDALIKDLFTHWAVEFVAKWFWLKITRTGKPIINFASPPAKAPFERVIIATKIKRNAPNTNGFDRKDNNNLRNKNLCTKRIEEINNHLGLGSAENGRGLVGETEAHDDLKIKDGNISEEKNLGTRNTTCTNYDIKESNGRIIVSVPSALHSHKPPLEELLRPYLPKGQKCLEIFARYLLPNYTSFGLETLRFQNTWLYKKQPSK